MYTRMIKHSCNISTNLLPIYLELLQIRQNFHLPSGSVANYLKMNIESETRSFFNHIKRFKLTKVDNTDLRQRGVGVETNLMKHPSNSSSCVMMTKMG